MKLGAVTRISAFPASDVGVEVVPGYVLIGRIGEDGSGEVWAAEGPGGFAAALKFVRQPDGPGAADLRALEILRSVRHPNVLSTFGSFLKTDWLIIAMERADGTLRDRFHAAVAEGSPGIPRDELVAALAEAAHGIDYLNQARHAHDGRKGLWIQHRDIKPRNIHLVGGGVKVGGLARARWMEDRAGDGTGRAFAPGFDLPECFAGSTSRHSDQFDLALTYCQLRGGRSPFPGSSTVPAVGRLMPTPDLLMIDAAERPAVARALANDPGARWESCRAFLDALRSDLGKTSGPPLNSSADVPKLPAVAEVGREATMPSIGPPPDEAPRGPDLPGGPSNPAVAQDAGSPRVEPPASDAGLAGETPGDTEDEGPARAPCRLGRRPAARIALRGAAAATALIGFGGLVVWGGGLLLPPKPEAAPRRATPARSGHARAKLDRDAPIGGTAPDRAIDAGARPEIFSRTQEVRPPALPLWISSADHLKSAISRARPLLGKLSTIVAPRPNERPEAPGPAEVSPPRMGVRVPDSAVVAQVGEDVRFDISVLRGDPSRGGPVELTFAGVPIGLDLGPITIPADEQVAHVAARADAESRGRIRVSATAGESRAEAEFEIEVQPKAKTEAPPPKISLRLAESIDVPAGRAVKFPVKVDRRGHADPIEIRFEGVPGELRLSGAVIPGDRSEAECEAVVAREDVDKSANVRVIASAGALRDEATVRLNLRPSAAIGPRLRGDALLARGEFGRAIAAYQEATRLAATDAASAFGLARALAASGDLDRAIPAFDEAIRLDPTNPQAYKSRGDARQRKGDLAGAIGDHGEALRIRPDDAATLNKRGILHIGQRQPYLAIADFDEALRLSPDEAAYHYNRGWIYERLGDPVEAVAEFDAAIRLDPKFAMAYKSRAATHARRGDLARAKADEAEATRLEAAAAKATRRLAIPSPWMPLPPSDPTVLAPPSTTAQPGTPGERPYLVPPIPNRPR